MANFTESVVEEAALAWLESLGYAVKHGPEIAPSGDPLPRGPKRRGSFLRRCPYGGVIVGVFGG
jgi:hypothetical protein